MVVGILCLIIGIVIILLYGDYKKIPNAKKTIGNLCFKEKGHELRVKYLVDGKEYYIKVKKKYKKPVIKYNLKNPNQAMIIHNVKDYLGPLFFIVLGILIICYTVFNNLTNNDDNMCCTCLDEPFSDACCRCDYPYLNE